MEQQRLSKILGQKNICSRREAEDFIRRGWVSLEGKVISELGTKAYPGQEIQLHPQALKELRNKVCIALHKPLSYVSSPDAKNSIRAIKLIQEKNQYGPETPKSLLHLAPVGRLDSNSTGLMLFTQDGVLAKQIIGAESNIEKEYLVGTNRNLQLKELDQLKENFVLDGQLLKPMGIEVLEAKFYKIILTEGKNRQIRRMLESFENLKVRKIKRVRIGKLVLGDLPLGKWRTVSKTNIL